uniref:Protein kinase domain-containing protein n=1 Tax=Panagrellus redivivus TaxID=6233 RepID=A0A7E4VCE4_PANRE
MMNFMRAVSPKPHSRANSLREDRLPFPSIDHRNDSLTAAQSMIPDRPTVVPVATPGTTRGTSGSTTSKSDTLSISSVSTVGMMAVQARKAKSKASSCLPTTDIPDVASLQIPLDKHYTDLKYHCIAGYHWVAFDAKGHIGKIDASVLIFEKKRNIKASSRIGKNRLSLIDLIKFDIAQLTPLVHPFLLRVLHPLEENKDVMCFACESIHCTLDQLIAEEKLDIIEKKLGVLYVIRGLTYLHGTAKLLHGNLNPAAVFVTTSKIWKIGSLQFSINASTTNPSVFPCYPWTKKLPLHLQPELDFLAPEYLDTASEHVTVAADTFSCGALIYYIYTDGKRLIDAHNNLESYNIIINQLDAAIAQVIADLGPELANAIGKLVVLKPTERLSLSLLPCNKHFEDAQLKVIRELDEVGENFDPNRLPYLLATTLIDSLPKISEALWFNRILPRFNEHFATNLDVYPSLLKPLLYMLNNCESHNIYKLRSWFRRITENAPGNDDLTIVILECLPVIIRRLNDEDVEDRCYALLLSSLSNESHVLKQSALKAIPASVDYMSFTFVRSKLIPLLLSMEAYFQDNIQRQVDLLTAVAHLSDRCDAPTLQYLLTLASVCSSVHPSIVHAKSRLVQQILHTDISRLTDSHVITQHLLNPLIVGLSLPELNSAHFDDVMSSVRILLDIIEQIRYESDDFNHSKRSDSNRLYSRRVSMSSSHLPRLLVTAARPSFSGDSRKMSFLSADGRLEDRGRRESNQSKSSFESDMSILIGNGSDLSDESGIVTAQRGRRKSWLEGYMHSMSLEQGAGADLPVASRGLERHRRSAHEQQIRHHQSARARSNRSPTNNEFIDCKLQQQPARPNSFTNLGHNLACTLWKTFY